MKLVEKEDIVVFNKKDALKVEYINFRNSKGRKITTYTYKCIVENCNNTIRVQYSKEHNGKCRRCSQRKRPYEYILAELYQRYKEKRNIEVTLTYEELVELISNPFCHYCNSKVEYSEYTRNNNKIPTTRAYQLDRKDNNKGYTLDNVVVCCWNCNRLKSNLFSYDEFLEIAVIMRKIMQNRKMEVVQ